MERNFENFLDGFNDKRKRGEEKFQVKSKSKIKRIDELFDTEDLRAEHEIPWMKGDFGPGGESSQSLVSDLSLDINNPLLIFHSNLLMNFRFIANLKVVASGPERILYELSFETNDDEHYMKSRLSLDVSLNDLGDREEYTYYFDCIVSGEDIDGTNYYEQLNENIAQGVSDFDGIIKSLKTKVKPLMERWGTITGKWFGDDPINSIEAKRLRFSERMN